MIYSIKEGVKNNKTEFFETPKSIVDQLYSLLPVKTDDLTVFDPFAKGTAVEDCRAYPRSSCSNNNFDISFESFDIWKEVREKAELEQSKFGHC